jgi:uncharacterized protein YuzE
MAEAGVGIRVEALRGAVPRIPFKWDPETEILSGRFGVPAGNGFTGSVELEGEDGAFVLLDVEHGTVCGIEVVVWPEVEDQRLVPPDDAAPGRLTVAAPPAASGVGVIELETAVECFAAADERTFHFLFGEDREATPVRVADGLIVELDAQGAVAGLWLLDVPPYTVEE